MFGIKQKLDNIYDLLISFNNNERHHSKSAEVLARKCEKDNEKLALELDSKNLLLEIQRAQFEQELSILKEENKKLHDYLEKVADILKENQKAILSQNKITKVDLMTEKMNKISDEAKAKLK